MRLPKIRITYPDWIERVDWERRYASVPDRVQLTISLARENVLHDTGGPFGAAVFESESGRLVAVGVNLVVPLNNCTLHGEMVAFMMAQQRLASYTLNAVGHPRHEIVTSSEPCAMCLGATSWSGVRRLVYGARADDARRLGFDEGPALPQLYEHLAAKGIDVVGDVCREDAVGVLRLYMERMGPIYNA